MKIRYVIGTLFVGCTLFACESHINDREDEFIIPDKGLDIDDDKTHQTPNKDDKPGTPGDVGDTPFVNDSIPSSGQEEEPPIAPPIVEPDTKYITGDQQDTTWIERESHVLDSHVVIQSGGCLQMIETWTMSNDATITIEEGGYLVIYGQLKVAVISVKAGGTLNIGQNGSIILKSRESLHLEEGAIIQCDGKEMNNEGLHILAPSADDPLSSALEKIDSLYIESIR